MAPVRTRNVRVSVRIPTETTSTDGFRRPVKTFPHTRYQRLEILEPVSGLASGRMDRAAYDATWRAVARRPPDIPDGARIVTLKQVDSDTYEDDLVLHVQKSLPNGRHQALLLREAEELQPPPPA